MSSEGKVKMYLSKDSKTKIYYLYFRNSLNGKYNRVSTKTKFKSEAFKFVSDFKNSLNQKNEQTPRLTKNISIEDVETEFLKYIFNNLTKSSYDNYKTAIKHFKGYFHKKPLNTITIKDVEEFKTNLSFSMSKTSVNIYIITLTAMINYLIKWGYLQENIFRKTTKFKITEKEILCFSDIQVKQILSKTEDKKLKQIISVALYTGMRISEILNLQYKDIDLNSGFIRVHNKENFRTKSGKNREIPISDNLNNALMSIMNLDKKILNLVNPETYLFTIRYGLKYSKDYITKKFKGVLRKLQFPEKFHFHCLRHTFITNLIKSNVNINFVKEIAGHSDIKTTMKYIHISTEDLREAVNKISL
jgi:site-specific recombinase XerD